MILSNTLEHAEYLVGLVGLANPGFYEFFIESQTLALRKFNYSSPKRYVLLQVGSHDLNSGLTTKQWNELDAAIRTARKEGLLK